MTDFAQPAATASPPQDTRDRASQAVAAFLGSASPPLLEEIAAHLDVRLLSAGEVLCRQGEAAHELYFLASGRLQVLVDADTPQQRLIGEVARGETAGEMGVIAGLPRSATVRAVRDCEVMALTRSHLEALIRSHPELALALARQVVLRLDRTNRQGVAPRKRPSAVAVVGTPGAAPQALAFAQALAGPLAAFGTVRVATASEASAALQVSADHLQTVGAAAPLLARQGQLAAWLDDLESHNDCLLLAVPDPGTAWGRACLRHCDEVLWLADAAGDVAAQVARLGAGVQAVAPGITRRLVLLHAAARTAPTHTAAWLALPVDDITHVCPDRPADLQRLGRVLAGQSIGITFSGGGARGFAHLGIYRALWEAGVPIDAVAGTSMGAGVGSCVARGLPPDEAIDTFRRIFEARPTSDLNVFPLVSLIAGQRLRRLLEDQFRAPDGTPLHIEDCWKPFQCAVTDFSRSALRVFRRGPMATLVQASMALPGFLPPVLHEGSALIDGGVFNNFPCDLMRESGVRHVVGVDLKLEPFGPTPGDGVPGTWSTLVHWWRTQRGAEEGRIPSMRELLVRLPTLSSGAHQAQAAQLADVLLRPEVADIRIVDWKAMSLAIERGYRHASERLEAGAFDQLLALGR